MHVAQAHVEDKGYRNFESREFQKAFVGITLRQILKHASKMGNKSKGKGKATEIIPEATLPLGKQLAHTGMSLAAPVCPWICSKQEC